MHNSAQTTHQRSPLEASTLDELLAYHDQQFVHCAYQTLLSRQPDPEGLAYYLNRLRTGIPKLRLLTQLRLSKEGKAHAANPRGLNAAVKRCQRAQYPLIGWLFRLLEGTEDNRPIERGLRVIENRLFLLGDENNRRFNQLEAALAGLRDLVAQQTPAPAGAMNTTLQTPEPDGLK